MLCPKHVDVIVGIKGLARLTFTIFLYAACLIDHAYKHTANCISRHRYLFNFRNNRTDYVKIKESSVDLDENMTLYFDVEETSYR